MKVSGSKIVKLSKYLKNICDSMTMRILILLLLPVGLFAPVVSSHAGSLSFTLFDLAEWTSLLPAERQAAISLALPFLLRIQIVVLLVLSLCTLTIRNQTRRAVLFGLIMCAVAISQLPPFEFLSQLDDPNYRQQMLIASLCLLGGFALSKNWLNHYTKYIALFVAVAASAAFVFALTQTHIYLTQYQIPYQLGLAAPALLLTYGVTAMSIFQTKRAPQRPSNSSITA